ncbi:D-alanyl-D-alanine carboxypeptidase family protein [Modestobacter sp. Leaf380]|uniref:D-alanyl-D-alanine carboxypeptidase family protein n=1 Tax=Modestobacter sp. Leaf380 TaxID=1736356 RepID=UPI000A85709B|nr:D-alanyl-D-alanine carboxypeptidase family protein [Modestobacter sp. Leaf380]
MRRRSLGPVLAALVVPAVLVGTLSAGTVPAVAAPSSQPGGTTGVLDSAELSALQEQAAQVQTDLQDRQAAVTAAQQQLDAAQAEADAATQAVADAADALGRERLAVGEYASAVYRDGGAPTPLGLLLGGADPGDVVSAMGYLDVVDARTAEVLAGAESRRQGALARQAAADQALAGSRAQADLVAAESGRLEAAAAAVTTELDRALGVVDRQLAQLQAEQLDVNAATAANWRAYVDQLAAAGVALPPATALRDPVAGLPAGLVPVGGVTGAAQAGAAQLPRQPSSLLVLPAETVAAVSAAMADLGLPYVPGTAGPESFDCGSLVQTAYGAAGVVLPGTQGELFASTAPVEPADVLPGDLVFLGTPESGLGHVGLALDRQTMLAADGRAGAVVVRTLPADQVLGIGRPSLATRDAVDVPGPTAGALPVECGNPVYPASYDGSRSWGGYPNGLIPPSAMCPLGVGGHTLRCDAAAAWRALSAAFAGQFGAPLCITDSYRSYAGQVTLYGQKPALAAVPGTSNHGWGLAVDLCGGVESFGTTQYVWMAANAGRFGFVHPTWADQGNGREEPWHWEYAAT